MSEPNMPGLPFSGNDAEEEPEGAAVVCGDLNMLRCLAGRGIDLCVVAWDPDEVTLRSRYCEDGRLISPPTTGERAVEDLERVGNELGGRPVLYYGNDAMLLLISRYRERLSRCFRFRMPGAELVDDTVDKARFATLAEAHGLPVPRTLTHAEELSPEELLERVGLPCLLKPSSHTRWHAARAARGAPPMKALRAETESELVVAHEELRTYSDSFVAQQWIRGGDERILSYHAYLDAASQPLGEYCGKKIRTYPRDAGVSTYLELVREPRLLELGRAIAQQLSLVGPLKLDFKVDSETDVPYLLEVNARFTLWNRLGAACGVNLPLIAYRDLMGQRCECPRDYRTDIRWLSFSNDFRTFLRDYLPTGELSWSEWLGSYRGPKVYDVFAWNDPVPFGASLLQYPKALAARLAKSRHGAS
jgi:predicted ATP-grasp superfamily ATP-dependent carboligase